MIAALAAIRPTAAQRAEGLPSRGAGRAVATLAASA